MSAALRARARQLQEKWPAYGPLLDFYVAVREAQDASRARAGAAATLFLDLCRLGKAANPHFAAQTERIEQAVDGGALNLAALLADGAPGSTERAATERGLDARVLDFLVQQSVRPSLEAARDRFLAGFDPDSWRKLSCPACGGAPAVGLLNGDPVLRYSVCARCGCQWRVDRLSCALCGNRAPDSLEYFHGEGETAWRIDLCASGRHYIKTIDVRGLEAPDPVLEDLATLHLDVLAAEKGYSRGASNPWNPS